jgi:NAD(P)H-flavin reductase
MPLTSTMTRCTSRTVAAAGQVLLTLEVDVAAQRTHSAVGQYVLATTPAGKGFFALCNAPGQAWQLLVKGEGAAAGHLASAPLDVQWEVSPAHGRGFDLDGLCRTVLVIGGGTGMAPLWPLTQALVARGVVPRVLYSATHEDALAFRAPLAALHDAGKVALTLLSSREPAPIPPVRPGHVTDLLVAGNGDFSDVTAFVAGPPGMVEAVGSRLRSLGTAEEHVRTNY